MPAVTAVDRGSIVCHPSPLAPAPVLSDVPLGFAAIKPYASLKPDATRAVPLGSGPSAPDDELLLDLYRDVLDEDPSQPSSPPLSTPVDIPELPRGRVLELIILSNWGDPHMVGLAGLDLFQDTGAPLLITDPTAQVSREKGTT